MVDSRARLETRKGEMAESNPPSRRLSAILAADIVGFSALMGADEEATVQALKAHQAAVFPLIREFGDRIIDTAGDGVLAEFPSVLNAVKCAVNMQAAMSERNAGATITRRMDYRVGVNQGDVLDDGERLFGDGVNIAARLESLAKPGGICISGKVYDEVSGRLECNFVEIGEQSLKNIARPVRVYEIHPNYCAGSAPVATPNTTALSLPDKPSIAVLPFINISGDIEQEYFADGVVEDILTALSRFNGLFVIGRNSSFTYKGRSVDLRQIGRELGVRYVLEGSIRRSAARIRITTQLVDAATGAHVWADRFDGLLEDVFSLQDEITASVVGALLPKLEQAEIERAKRKEQPDLTAYDLYLRALPLHRSTEQDNLTAISLLRDAERHDPAFPMTYALTARCYVMRAMNGWTSDEEKEVQEARRVATLAVKYGGDDADVVAGAAMAFAYVLLETDTAAALIEEAVGMNPNCVVAWTYGSFIKTFCGEPQIAVEYATRAIRLSPVDPRSFLFFYAMAHALFFLGKFDESVAFAKRSIAVRPSLIAFLTLAASCARSGLVAEAREAVSRGSALFRPIQPKAGMYRCPKHFNTYLDALRLAGFPGLIPTAMQD